MLGFDLPAAACLSRELQLRDLSFMPRLRIILYEEKTKTGDTAVLKALLYIHVLSGMPKYSWNL
jgi:hypothetical protein